MDTSACTLPMNISKDAISWCAK